MIPIKRQCLLRSGKQLYLFIFLALSLSAKHLRYIDSDIHTLTLSKHKGSISLEYLLMNDTIDLFNLKSKELGNSATLGAIGDLNGYNIKLNYGIFDSLTLVSKFSKQSITYADTTLSNTQNDIYLRYNFFNHPLAFFNSGISMDIGYVTNSSNNYYLKDKIAVKQMLSKIPDSDIVKASNGKISKFKPNDPEVTIFNPFGTNPKVGDYYYLQNNSKIIIGSDLKGFIDKQIDNAKESYISLTDTNDKSTYIRLLIGFYDNDSITDFYIGIKNTKVESILKAKIDTLPSVVKSLNHTETSYFLGFNYSISKNKIAYEINYEYERFNRDKKLDYINYNHIIKTSISYAITRNIFITLNSKLMYRQFNGQIPYMYNQYTQTTFDHKYGYTGIGLHYLF